MGGRILDLGSAAAALACSKRGRRNRKIFESPTKARRRRETEMKIYVTFESMATNIGGPPIASPMYVPSKRTDAYMMSSVHWSIEMCRKWVTALLGLFRNHVRIELS